MRNSFKELEDAQVRLFDHQRQKRVFDRVESTLDTFRLFGSIFEMYVPILGETLMTLGGKENENASVEQDDAPVRHKQIPPSGPDFTTDESGIR